MSSAAAGTLATEPMSSATDATTVPTEPVNSGPHDTILPLEPLSSAEATATVSNDKSIAGTMRDQFYPFLER
jgi:hypothetical protein